MTKTTSSAATSSYLDIIALKAAAHEGRLIIRDDTELLRWLMLRRELATAADGILLRGKTTAGEWGMSEGSYRRYLDRLQAARWISLEASLRGSVARLGDAPSFVVGTDRPSVVPVVIPAVEVSSQASPVYVPVVWAPTIILAGSPSTMMSGKIARRDRT